MHFFVFVSIIDGVLYVVKMFMKKVFIQIRQWILKHKKKLIYWVFAFVVGQICFFDFFGIWIENEVFADGNTVTQNDLFQQETTEWYEKMSFLSKVVYVLVYPLLLLAWKLVDNSFVYWEIFWFDAVLWQLWNILKNLANYTLWFFFVYKIFTILLKKQEPWDIKNLLINSLIAWVWIQASWFIMASLIDISTILAYSIWWLPISVLKETDKSIDDIAYNPYILKNVVEADVQDIDTVHMYLTNTQVWNKKSGDFYISECETFSYKYGWRSEELILAPRIIYYIDKQWNTQNIKKTDMNRCHFYGQVYYFGSLYGEISQKFVGCSDEKNCKDAQNAYKEALDTAKTQIIKTDTGDVVGLIRNVQILQIWDAHTTWWVIWGLWPVVYSQDKQWLDLYNKWTWTWWVTSRLQDIMDGNSYVGVFTALYSSLLHSWRGIIPPDAWTFAALLNVALALWHVLAIGIPLIAVAIVFIMRVGILWMAVALSPFIVLWAAFNKEIWEKIFKWKFLECFRLKNLIPIIFSPAIICFAISISTVLVTIISELNFSGITTVKPEILGWLIELDIWGLSIWIWKFIISVFWIAITWFLVWAAVKSSKLWQLVGWLEKLAAQALWSIPIVPILSKWEDWKLKADLIWTNAAFGDNWIIPRITSDIQTRFSNKDNEVLQDLINSDRVKERRADAYGKAIVNFTPTSTQWTSENITLESEDGKPYSCKFVDLINSKKEWIIAAINGLDEAKRSAFGASQPEVKFNNWEKEVTYKFNKNGDKKYDLV